MQHFQQSEIQLPTLRYRPLKDNIVLSLLDICQSTGIQGAQVDTYVVREEAAKKAIKLYKLTVPHLGNNAELVSKIDLPQFNKNQHAHSFMVFENNLPVIDYSDPQATFDKLFRQNRLKPAICKTNLSFTDLTAVPFISTDSAGVRVNDRPVYADIDDAIYVEESVDGFTCMVAFADITPFSQLKADDPLLLNSKIFGYSVYGASPHIPMIGAEAEEICSLLGGKERYAWIVQFDLSPEGKPELGRAKVFRAKIKNHLQMDYDTIVTRQHGYELAENITNIRRAARILELYNTPNTALQVYRLKGETANAKAVAQFMIHSRNVLGYLLAEKNHPAIFRIQNSNPAEPEALAWIQELKEIGHPASPANFRSASTLIRKLVSLLESSGSAEARIGLTILDLMSGKGCYSLQPLRHDDLGFQPYPKIKGLRELPGFVNQHIVNSVFGDSADPIDLQLLDKLCKHANHCRGQIQQVNSLAAYLQLLINRQNPARNPANQT